MISGLQLLLGGALVIEKEYAEGEKLLIKGYPTEGFPSRLLSACRGRGGSIDFAYIKTNKPDEVTKWRTERAKYPRELAPAPRAVK